MYEDLNSSSSGDTTASLLYSTALFLQRFCI